jgi:hypothetical protein
MRPVVGVLAVLFLLASLALLWTGWGELYRAMNSANPARAIIEPDYVRPSMEFLVARGVWGIGTMIAGCFCLMLARMGQALATDGHRLSRRAEADPPVPLTEAEREREAARIMRNS